jgi:CheY-like chemotaxis protein
VEDRTLHLVLVDDDEVDVITVQRAFASAQTKTRLFVARDGVEALALLRGGTVPKARRIMVLDLEMPRMNGLELLRELRADPALQTLPVIVMTTSDEDRDRVEAFQLNVAGYMVKPPNYQAFAEAMIVINKYWSLMEV